MATVPRVSVIIPTFNRAHLLPNVVQSVLNQTFADFELIIVDDASTDNTQEVVESFSDPRIRYIKHEQNKGGGAARNTGIEAARGEFIAFLDSDDEWIPQKLEIQVPALSQAGPEVGFVICGMRNLSTMDGLSYFSEKSATAQGNIVFDLLEGTVMWHLCGLMAKTSKVREIGGFDPLLPSAQDFDFILRLSQICLATSVPDILAVYHHHDGPRITRNMDALIAGRERVLDKHWNLIKHSNRFLCCWYREFIRFCLLAGYRDKALRYLIAAFKLSSFTAKFSLLAWFALIILKPSTLSKLLDFRRYWRLKILKLKYKDPQQ